MGNIAVAEALKFDLSSGRTNIDNYVLMQAAVPAHCYDTNLANYARFLTAETNTPTPDMYRGYAGNISSAVRGSLVNFYNTNDFALATGTLWLIGEVNWEANQVNYKPDVGLDYSSNETNAYKGSTLVTDARQIMSFVARPRSKAAGALPGVGGVVATAKQVDLKTSYGFDRGRSEHSAEFNFNIQRLNGFYIELLDKLFPPQP